MSCRSIKLLRKQIYFQLSNVYDDYYFCYFPSCCIHISTLPWWSQQTHQPSSQGKSSYWIALSLKNLPLYPLLDSVSPEDDKSSGYIYFLFFIAPVSPCSHLSALNTRIASGHRQLKTTLHYLMGRAAWPPGVFCHSYSQCSSFSLCPLPSIRCEIRKSSWWPPALSRHKGQRSSLTLGVVLKELSSPWGTCSRAKSKHSLWCRSCIHYWPQMKKRAAGLIKRFAFLE